MHFPVDTLINKLAFILKKNGISTYHSNLIAKIMVDGDRKGYSTHGCERIFQLLDGLKQGTISNQYHIKKIRKTKSVETWDAKNSIGQISGHNAMLAAVKLAQSSGIGLVGVINASHLGILSYYSELAAKNGCIGIVLTTSSPAVALPKGKIKTFGTNPISFSIPHTPFNLTGDFATSKVSRGRVINALANKESIPLTWAVDQNGLPTESPQKALEGGLQVFDNDYKGSLLSFLFSILAGPLLGGVSNDKVRGTRYMSDTPNKGDFFLAIHIPSLTDVEQFNNSIQQFIEFISIQNSDFSTPGLLEYNNKINAYKNGIITSEKLQQLFKNYGT